MLHEKACALILVRDYSSSGVTLRRYIYISFFCAISKLHSVARPHHVTLQFLGLRHQIMDQLAGGAWFL